MVNLITRLDDRGRYQASIDGQVLVLNGYSSLSGFLNGRQITEGLLPFLGNACQTDCGTQLKTHLPKDDDC